MHALLAALLLAAPPSRPPRLASTAGAVLLAAASSGPAEPPAPDPARLLARLAAGEPSVARVQAAAAAEVERAVPDPAALAERRRLAALLPELTAELRAEERSYRVVGMQATSEVDYLRSSPGTVIVVRASWALPDLVVSRGEPQAASAALARQRRREEAVRRATALYFERRRLLALAALDPPASALGRVEAELELDRVTAELDALTGGLYAGRGGP